LKKNILLLLLSLGFTSCFLFKKENPVPEPPLPIFNANPTIFPNPVTQIDETSGMVVSRNNQGIWIHEDSNNPPLLYLIDTQGKFKKNLPLLGAVNRDWEDIAIGPGPIENRNYIYLADIGDNLAQYKEYYIHRFLEPENSHTQINAYETITFKYPNNESYDAETLLIDPTTKDLYIITKREFNVRVYRLPFPQSTNSTIEANFLGTIPYFQITAGDISSDGKEILLKNYIAVFYWRLRKEETIFQALSRPRDIGVPYIREHQGEAIAWTPDAKGFYTLSERGEMPEAPKLYYYFKD
jgi:hypothetical protein